MNTGPLVRERKGGRAVGWRVWTVQERPEGVLLGSVIHEALWTPCSPALAACSYEAHHLAPDADCNCGFHAARDPVDVFSYLHGRNESATICRILGEVLLSGHLVETEGGWRASESYPLRLYLRDSELAAALAGYGVPVLFPGCGWRTATSSSTASAGSPTNSCSAARMRSSPTAGSG